MSIQDNISLSKDRIPLEDAAFSVMARVAMQLGRESISSSIIAISELVKNAYDADAENVNIIFRGVDTENPFMMITDDGNGMTQKQLKNQWMVIGTSNKLLSGQSSNKMRQLTGEKGLGRLGLDRLGKQTTIQTFVKNETRGIELIIDWEKYEDENDKKLESIKHNVFSISKYIKDFDSQKDVPVVEGTYITIYNLKDVWDKDFFQMLKQELTLLISPFEGRNDFSINIDSGMPWEDINGKIGSRDMLNAAEWVVYSKINEDGSIIYEMTSPINLDKYTLNTTWQERFRDQTIIPKCGPLTFNVYFFPRKAINIENIKFTLTQITGFLNLNQGIRIYRDNFRVKPYGQPTGEGDWLNLSYRRQGSPGGVTQPGWKVGYNQTLGAVFISRKTNPLLVDQTNREGIVEGDAFNDLKTFTLDVIGWLESNRTEFERNRIVPDDFDQARKDAEDKINDSVSAAKELQDKVTEVDDLLNNISSNDNAKVAYVKDLLKSAVTSVIQKVDDAQKAQDRYAQISQEQQEDFQRQKDTLANLASLGILTAGFGHETLGASNLVLTNAKDIKESLIDGMFMLTPDTRELIEKSLDVLVYEAERIETFADFALQNVSRDKRERKSLYLDDVIKRVYGYFSRSLEEKNIKVSLEFPKKRIKPILAFEIDWESIIMNLITNAVWALEDTKASNRYMRIELKEDDQYLYMIFSDSGRGIATGTINSIFMPTFSTKRNRQGKIIGTGMGLTIVKNFVEEYKEGSITVESPGPLGGAQFTIRIRFPDLASRGIKGGY